MNRFQISPVEGSTNRQDSANSGCGTSSGFNGSGNNGGGVANTGNGEVQLNAYNLLTLPNTGSSGRQISTSSCDNDNIRKISFAQLTRYEQFYILGK